MKAFKQTVRKYYKYIISTYLQPTLTGNGVWGSSDTAVKETVGNISTTYSGPVYGCFNGVNSVSANNWANLDFRFYSKIPLKITQIKLLQGVMAQATKGGKFYYSKDDSSWIQCGSFTGQPLNTSTYTTFNTSVDGYYNYYRILLDEAYTYSNGNRHVSCGGIKLIGTQRTTIAGTEDDYDYYEDVLIYKLPKLENKYYGINQ